MKRLFISSVQKEFEHERAAIKRMIESDPILKPYFTVFVFEIDAPASDKSTQQVYLEQKSASPTLTWSLSREICFRWLTRR